MRQSARETGVGQGLLATVQPIEQETAAVKIQRSMAVATAHTTPAGVVLGPKKREPRLDPVEDYYGVVLAGIVLSSMEKQQLMDLVRKKEAGPLNVRERLRAEDHVTQAKLQAAVTAENAAIVETYRSIQGLLGEDRFRLFRGQEVLLPACNSVECLEERMKSVGEPLTDQQTQQLLKLFLQPQRGPEADQIRIAWQTTRSDGSLDFDLLMESRRDAPISTEMIIAAHAFLSLGQIEAMRQQEKLFVQGKR